MSPDTDSETSTSELLGRAAAVAGEFDFDNPTIKILEGGNINWSFTCTEVKEQYVLQLINPIFNRAAIKHNTQVVIAHINTKIRSCQENGIGQHLLNPIESEREMFFTDEYGDLWRILPYIEGQVYEVIESPQMAREIGKIVALFHDLLSDLDPNKLQDPLPHFHDTEYCLSQLKAAYASPYSEHTELDDQEHFEEIHHFVTEILAFEDRLLLLANEVKAGDIPKRACHNDPKANNVILYEDGRAKCIVDLDTVNASSVLFDIGDMIRSAGSTATEDEQDLSKVEFNLDNFEQIIRGYLENMIEVLTPNEIRFILYSYELLAMELSIRFLADYLSGNIYFSKIDYLRHNYVKARNQWKLAMDMRAKRGQAEAIVRKILKELGYEEEIEFV